MTPFYSSTFWALTVCDTHFCIWKMCEFVFMGFPVWSILVCKIPEFWRWKLWDQKFIPSDLRNIQIKESKKPGFTFSIKLRTKFGAHSLLFAFLQRYLIWSSKVNLVAILTLTSFSQLLLCISEFRIFISLESLELMIKWHLSVFLFILLYENHWKSFSDDCFNMKWLHRCIIWE